MDVIQPQPAQGAVPEDDGAPPHRYKAAMAAEIESRWQARWAAEGTFEAANPGGPLSGGFGEQAGRRKFYILDMFPYPSGTGLHVGHRLGAGVARGNFQEFLKVM